MTPKKPTWKKILELMLQADPMIWVCGAMIVLMLLLAYLLG